MDQRKELAIDLNLKAITPEAFGALIAGLQLVPAPMYITVPLVEELTRQKDVQLAQLQLLDQASAADGQRQVGKPAPAGRNSRKRSAT